MTARILVGDIRAVLVTLPDESIHCCITSVPYWGLRAYGTEPQVWGGESEHEHVWGEWQENHDEREPETVAGKTRTSDRFYGEESRRFNGNHQNHTAGAFCPCGAWRGELGLEPTIDLYLEHMVAVFQAVKRVLRRDGTLFLNVGDSYASGSPSGAQGQNGQRASRSFTAQGVGTVPVGLKPKDLCMMPARLALALQARGWYLRSEIVWAKPNPMPESVTDRPTSAHEKVYLLTKSERYFYDSEAVREESSQNTHRRAAIGADPSMAFKMEEPGKGNRNNSSFQSYMRDLPPEAGRNLRNVWTIPSAPFPEAHFATFPPEIPRRAILAGTSQKGCCPECGAPWTRVVERVFVKLANRSNGRKAHRGEMADINSHEAMGYNEAQTTGWVAGCAHGLEPVPATVLDPFTGSGTTNMVAERLGRDSIGIDLSPEYCRMAERRVANAFAELPSGNRHGQDSSQLPLDTALQQV